tara:strand:- start:398 stop:799 length:402 start_codon:yes stop_codon:yes gene_type:complete
MNLEILKIASDTTNLKNLNNYTHKGKCKNSVCGDEMVIKIRLRKNKIEDLGYNDRSCVYCQASASLISKYFKKKDLMKIKKVIRDINYFYQGKDITLDRNLKKIFNEKNLNRKECIYLPIKTFFNALKFNSNQ